MIEEIQFSDRGDGTTEFELRLLAQSKSASPWVEVARRLAEVLGPAAAARALVCVLDELGGEKINIPPRRHFFKTLWAAERDALIVELAARDDWTQADIARALGVSPVYVHHKVRGKPGGPTGAKRHGRHRQ